MTNVPGKGNRQAQYERRYFERRHWLDSVKIAAGCKDCGCPGPAEVLTFDHVRGDKKFGVGSSWNQGKQALVEEIAKCEIVCANCHARRTKARNGDGPVFVPHPKTPRLNREIWVTEKIDGSNGTVWVDGDLNVWAGSRNGWLPRNGEGQDNFGFAAWVGLHEEEFKQFGPRLWRGEWWGSGIQRNYGQAYKRFALFNVWDLEEEIPQCCETAPVLFRGNFDLGEINAALGLLRESGSRIAPGFMDPEGIVVYHTAAGINLKVTLKDDDKPKGLA